MKRWIHAATELVTKDDIRKAADRYWGLQINQPDTIAWCNDDYGFYVVNLNQAVDFLNSSEAQPYIEEESGEPFYALMGAYRDNQDCGVTTFNLPDSVSRADAYEIAHVFKEAGEEIPDWLYE